MWNNNYLHAYQTVWANNNTGHNTNKKNIGGMGGILTGNAGSTASQSVSGNENTTGIALWGANMPMGGNLFSIVNTGANANTIETATTNNNVGTANSNTLWGVQATWSNNSSGWNWSSKNIGSSTTATGFAVSGAGQGVSNTNSNATFIGSFFDVFPFLAFWLL